MAKTLNAQVIKKLHKRLSDELEEQFPAELTEKLTTEIPEKPDFPSFVFWLNIIADIFSILAFFGVALGGVGWLVKWFIILPLRLVVTTIWLFGKGSFIKKYLFKKLWRKLLLRLVVDAFIFYPWSPFVLLVHNRENKIVQAFWIAAGDLQDITSVDMKNLKREAASNVTRYARKQAVKYADQATEKAEGVLNNEKVQRIANNKLVRTAAKKAADQISDVPDNIVRFPGQSVSNNHSKNNNLDLRDAA
ncbi:hypothetical protein N9L18_00115 [Candidatus Pacebacteria bacterium]|nr:hypothetical protein [Candidatus Paceibacterota bacterium]